MLRTALIASLLALTGCAITIDANGLSWGINDLVVNGIELDEEHEETLEITAWDASGLKIESSHGDFRVEHTDGPSEIHVTLHEATAGDARAYYEDGVLTTRTQSGDPALIGDVLVLSNTPIAVLELETGLGDIEVASVRVTDELALVSGMGDIEADSVGETRKVTLASGMGDIELLATRCESIEAGSGMGDVLICGVTAANAELDAGMGDVEIHDSRFGELEAETGLGSIRLKRTSYERGDLDTGLGKIVRD